MLGIMAGMNQKDSFAAIVFALVVVFGSGMCFAGITGVQFAFVPFRCRQAQDALHHGR